MHPPHHDTHDREHLITDALEKDRRLVVFDSLGVLLLRPETIPGSRSPETRANRLSLFEEITSEQLKTYSPSQVATLLKQRENVLDVLSQQHQAAGEAQRLYYPSGSDRGHLLRPPPGLGGEATAAKPWVPRTNEECQARFCHGCRPSCSMRAYLSLDGVLNGEVPPTAATGFGFHRMGTRPIVNAKLLEQIGLRPVPLPRVQPQYHAALLGYDDKHRPPYTPPCTPSSWTGIRQLVGTTSMFEHAPFVCDGRSPLSLKTSDKVRRQVVRSIAGLMHQPFLDDDAKEFRALCSFDSPNSSRLHGTGAAPTASETTGQDGGKGRATSPMIEEREEGRFHEGPLEVREGIAVLEESVELGVPDVITQT
ncbi:hypothetical protein F4802DRAFT_617216 [Xylaria palmicola]|nr:hypothetical protein F4802DRAFT_617216 [Xylaria palmicola]